MNWSKFEVFTFCILCLLFLHYMNSGEKIDCESTQEPVHHAMSQPVHHAMSHAVIHPEIHPVIQTGSPTGSPTSSPTGSPINRTLLVYNRLPKTSSETFLRYIETASKKSHFGHREFTLREPPVEFFDMTLYKEKIVTEARNILNSCHGNAVLTGHFHWVDLEFLKEEYPGLNIGWINIMREPVARLVSNYNYMRWGRRVQKRKDQYIASFGELPLENCTRSTPCLNELYFDGNRQTAMLMGDWNKAADFKWLKQNYDCLGIMENRTSFVNCFRSKFPEFFHEVEFDVQRKTNVDVSGHAHEIPEYALNALEVLTFRDRNTYSGIKQNLTKFI